MAEDPDFDLMTSVYSNNYNGVMNALANGADPNHIPEYGKPLLFSIANLQGEGNLRIATALLDAGADPNTQNEYGLSVLMHAARHGTANMIALLLERGADETFTFGPKAQTALDLCYNNANPKICRQIILNKQKREFKQQANNSIQMLSQQYARSTPPTKEDWRLILLNQKQKEFCDNPTNLYKYLGARWGLAEILGVPYGDLMFDKSQLCERLRLRLTQGLNVVEDL